MGFGFCILMDIRTFIQSQIQILPNSDPEWKWRCWVFYQVSTKYNL